MHIIEYSLRKAFLLYRCRYLCMLLHLQKKDKKSFFRISFGSSVMISQPPLVTSQGNRSIIRDHLQLLAAGSLSSWRLGGMGHVCLLLTYLPTYLPPISHASEAKRSQYYFCLTRQSGFSQRKLYMLYIFCSSSNKMQASHLIIPTSHQQHYLYPQPRFVSTISTCNFTT